MLAGWEKGTIRQPWGKHEGTIREPLGNHQEGSRNRPDRSAQGGGKSNNLLHSDLRSHIRTQRLESEIGLRSCTCSLHARTFEGPADYVAYRRISQNQLQPLSQFRKKCMDLQRAASPSEAREQQNAQPKCPQGARGTRGALWVSVCLRIALAGRAKYALGLRSWL